MQEAELNVIAVLPSSHEGGADHVVTRPCREASLSSPDLVDVEAFGRPRGLCLRAHMLRLNPGLRTVCVSTPVLATRPVMP